MKIDGTAVRTGMVIEYENKLWVVIKHEIRTPGNLSSFNQVEMKDVKTGIKTNTRLGSSDKIERASLDQRSYNYLFRDGDNLTFMDNENYEQIVLSANLIGERIAFLQDNMTVSIESYEGNPISISMPEKVTLRIEETEPVVRGQTASSSYKPAKMENGIRVMVPPFINSGDLIVVNTEDSSYVERAKAA